MDYGIAHSFVCSCQLRRWLYGAYEIYALLKTILVNALFSIT